VGVALRSVGGSHQTRFVSRYPSIGVWVESELAAFWKLETWTSERSDGVACDTMGLWGLEPDDSALRIFSNNTVFITVQYSLESSVRCRELNLEMSHFCFDDVNHLAHRESMRYAKIIS
jgi:hypothetical protein